MALDVMKADDEWTINTSLVPSDRTLQKLGMTREQYNRSDEDKFYPLPKPSLPEYLIP